jgi:hypothetical protein
MVETLLPRRAPIILSGVGAFRKSSGQDSTDEAELGDEAKRSR